ncbi:MAG TPA: hypothetical protein VM328_13235 [Fimbriimonadaceae bacterium]|nr:hypothetical protein [Fimbriimonadaceae bacterium]
MILGSGSHGYECIHDWLMPPEGGAFGDTHGLAQDSRGRIYLAHTVGAQSKLPDAVYVYDESGRFLRSWGSEFRGGAHGLDLRREGGSEFLYHCDTARRKVVKTDLEGKVVLELAAPSESGKYPNGEGFVPTNVAFHPGGGFFVGDGYGANWIHEYDAKGNYRRTFGGPGAEPGQVACPHGLWVDPRGREPLLVVADRSNRRLQYFDLDGRHVKFVAGEDVRLPCHFKFRQGQMLVPDLESRVSLYDESNKAIVHLGDGHPSGLRGKPRNEFVPGKFIHPHGAIFLRNGDILVAEWVPVGRVTLLKKI